jgi:hypothetical protein
MTNAPTRQAPQQGASSITDNNNTNPEILSGPARPAQDLRTSNRLAALAAEINKHHRIGRGMLNGAVYCAQEAGKALIEAKSKVPHGQWLQWLHDNCPHLSDRTARDYMRLVRLGIDEKTATVADLGLRATLKKFAKRHEFPNLSFNGKPGIIWLTGARDGDDMLFWTRDGVSTNSVITAADPKQAWVLKEPATEINIPIAVLAKQCGIADVKFQIVITPTSPAPEDIAMWCTVLDEYRRYLDSHAAEALA